jgi:hypothetical protein
MAMAAAVEDSDRDLPPSTGPAPRRKLSPLEEQKLVERIAARRSQRTLMKIMLWPSVLLGLLSLGAAGLGVKWWAFPDEKVMEIKADKAGLDHLYALAPKEGAPGQYEKIEVQPDILPGDSVKPNPDEGQIFVLNGQPVGFKAGHWIVTLTDKGGQQRQATLERHGLWFYEIDPATGQIKNKVEKLPLMAQQRSEEGDYVPVDVPEVNGDRIIFNKRGSDPKVPVDVVYYRAEDKFQTNKLGAFKPEDDSFMAGLRQRPWIFILAGLLIGGMLLGAAGFFAHQCYFSKAARAAKARAAGA